MARGGHKVPPPPSSYVSQTPIQDRVKQQRKFLEPRQDGALCPEDLRVSKMQENIRIEIQRQKTRKESLWIITIHPLGPPFPHSSPMEQQQ